MKYHYRACGLDNVFIENIDPVVDDAGETMVQIENVNGLHQAIAHSIVTKVQALNGKELRFLRTELGLTQQQLGELLRVDHQTVGRWERGEIAIDEKADIIVRLIAKEDLELEFDAAVEDITGWVAPSDNATEISIDGSNPQDYQPVAA